MIITGKISSFWYAPPQRLVRNLKWLKAAKVLVKDVWTTRLLPWIIRRFHRKTKNYFLIIRHPCATIESQLRTGIGNPLTNYRKQFIKNTILKQLNYIAELEDIKNSISHKLNSLNSAEELLAAIWAMDYYVPLYYNGSVISHPSL